MPSWIKNLQKWYKHDSQQMGKFTEYSEPYEQNPIRVMIVLLSQKWHNTLLAKSKNLSIIWEIFISLLEPPREYSMLRTTITLVAKKQLTPDVFELTYSCPDMIKEPPKAGQYVMFQLAPGLNRAYSIAIIRETDFTLIIKRIAEGRWSPIICDAEVGTAFNAMIPLGHFTLRDTPRSKCFIWTGTGFAPVYCQMLATSISANKPNRAIFIFWVRHFEDYFYESEIETIGKNFSEFQYIQYYSREENFEHTSKNHESRKWYVTDWITENNVGNYEEYYLCWSPAMVKSSREKLESLWIKKEDIFWEQF